MPLRSLLYIAIALFLFTGCIKQIEVATRNEKSILVVEGSITTDTVPYKVRLSYSGPFTRGNVVPQEYLEKEATVIITDDLGNSTTLEHEGDGIYATINPNYIGIIGRSYSISISLKDGRKYISTPEKIKPPVPIENVKTGFKFFTPSSINVYVDVNDPANEENYYRWSFYSWVPRKTNGIGCGFGCILYEYCFQRVDNENLTVLGDAAINGNTIRNQLTGSSPIYWFGKHYVDIEQHAITREAFHFYEQITMQQQRTGNLLDPLPAFIRGNVYNAANPNEFALGYFSGSSITHKKVILVPFSITPFLLNQTAAIFIPDGPKICLDAFPGTLYYPPPPANQNPPPPGWENAETVEVHW